ncbi:SET domain protein [Purpureocillium lavendulum]|uniref:Ribosomal lysine N-methyltransferase 4 n=1 Tax=Purpureocillium lavendulum TaxID=1247861 RepID=A0AB34FLT1_9HYPO|nr:SET domain protein [Purpureocillium lavendulum]
MDALYPGHLVRRACLPGHHHIMASTSFDERTGGFLEWFKSLPGAQFSSSIKIVDLRSRNAGRGIVATQDIPADATLFTIPRKAIISAETSGLRERIPRLFESHGDEDNEQQLDSWTALILILVYEHFQGVASPWKPYLDVLPETFDTPMFWTDAELDELQASAMRSKIGRADAETMFRDKLLPAVRMNPDVFPGSQGLNDDDLIALAHRMGSTIMAYAFDLENEQDEEENEDGWVEDREGRELMGMAHVNHEDESLTVTSLRPIKAGEEILNYYGPLPNSELLRRYGYVTERHLRYDVVEVPWDTVLNAAMEHMGLSRAVVDKAVSLSSPNERDVSTDNAKLELVDESELEDVFVLDREFIEPNSDGTFAGPAALEDMPADLQDQLKKFLKALKKLDDSLVPDKRKRDEVLQAILAKAILDIESRYPTTMADDELFLQHENTTPRRRMAALVRLGEKRLLHEAKELLSRTSTETGQDDAAPAKRARRAG